MSFFLSLTSMVLSIKFSSLFTTIRTISLSLIFYWWRAIKSSYFSSADLLLVKFIILEFLFKPLNFGILETKLFWLMGLAFYSLFIWMPRMGISNILVSFLDVSLFCREFKTSVLWSSCRPYYFNSLDSIVGLPTGTWALLSALCWYPG